MYRINRYMIQIDFTSQDVHCITLKRDKGVYTVDVTVSDTVQVKGYKRIVTLNLGKALDELILDTVYVSGGNLITIIPNGRYNNNSNIKGKVKLIANLEGIEYKYAEEETQSDTL